jgi:hypothetical protein
MSNIERSADKGVIEQIKDIEKVGLLYIKGYSNHEISSLMSLSVNQVKKHIEEYKKIISRQADDDPYFLERIQFNTLKALNEFDELTKEAWETVAIATDHGMVQHRISALKLASELATKKAQLHKLLSAGSNADGEYIQRMQKAENVNQILSKILRDVISKHPDIAEEVRRELALAFELMGQEDDFPERNVREGRVVD